MLHAERQKNAGLGFIKAYYFLSLSLFLLLFINLLLLKLLEAANGTIQL